MSLGTEGTGPKFAALVPELFLRAVFFKQDGSIPKHPEVASGVLLKVSSLICCLVSTIFAFFFCSSGNSQRGKIDEQSYNFSLDFWFFLPFWEFKGGKWWWTNSFNYPVEQSCVFHMFAFNFYRPQNMKHCWGDTCGDIFNTGEDMETSARLTIMQGGLPKSLCLLFEGANDVSSSSPSQHFPFRHQTTPLWRCVQTPAGAVPTHHTGIAIVSHEEWQQCPLISFPPVLTPLALLKPSFVCPHHLSQMFYLIKCSSDSGYVTNRILIRFADVQRKDLEMVFYWVLKTWAAFMKALTESRWCSTLISI